MSDPGAFSSELAKTHGPNWLKWLGHLVGKPALGLELGTWKGESAEWMLANVFTHYQSVYFCVDTFEGSDEHRKLGMDCTTLEDQTRRRLARFDDRAEVIKSASHDALKSPSLVRYGQFDFIYVDAAHDAMNVLRDSVLAFELLQPGGIIVWDDYEWTSMEDPIDRPKLGIDAFLSCYARRVEIIASGWQICARKIA